VPPLLPPGPDAVHLWSAQLPWSPSRIDALASTLDDAERAQRARFFFERDANTFVVSRGMRKSLLAAYLGSPPEALRFEANEFGKPALAREPRTHDDLRFNVSHSGTVVVMAVTRGREVGVDVEQIRPLRDLPLLAARSFSATECARVLAHAGDARVAAFFACWSRKEAVIKAIGVGLSFPLGSFDVEVAPDAPPALLRSADPRLLPERWSMFAIESPPGYASALMVEGGRAAIEARPWAAEP
jgi:4'-phosphopantetheinyl transferase